MLSEGLPAVHWVKKVLAMKADYRTTSRLRSYLGNYEYLPMMLLFINFLRYFDAAPSQPLAKNGGGFAQVVCNHGPFGAGE